ncbi:hypothetical protein EON80_19415 [bacterium]|nr:MAG: hypothetical protein EON80_19415 [bacterium]
MKGVDKISILLRGQSIDEEKVVEQLTSLRDSTDEKNNRLHESMEATFNLSFPNEPWTEELATLFRNLLTLGANQT